MLDARFITDLGDQAVVLPIAVVTGLVFVLSGWWRGALAWGLGIGGALCLMLAVKLGFLACGHLLPALRLNSPSGHTAAAAAIYGGLAGLLMRSNLSGKYWVLSCAVVVAIVVGATRLELGVHSLPEVVAGGVIGTSGAFVAVAAAGTPPSLLRMRRVVALGLVVLFFLHGFHLSVEPTIRVLAPDIWPFSACKKQVSAVKVL
jgi:membrane-associated phospholipid phosphatase